MTVTNIYQRLNTARTMLVEKNIQATGENKFAGYKYMELGDFLPAILNICKEVGICGMISFGDKAALTMTNVDKIDETIVFESPMATAELKGCHPVQNLGAVHTYLRRYLWNMAFEITEHDALDSTTPPATDVSHSKEDIDHYTRIKAALDALYGDDLPSKKMLIRRLTTFTGKDGKVVAGVEDYRKKTGKSLQILCHSIEKVQKTTEVPVIDVNKDVDEDMPLF